MQPICTSSTQIQNQPLKIVVQEEEVQAKQVKRGKGIKILVQEPLVNLLMV
jgi:hypothetical protein